ncbi:MAG TPA: nucleotidyltransferase domain-containing protein [Gammaproteobacteria bacterium]|nr:nucleotidyltransferase domain-containing protein [Gammaproteobacteria bacterium]
MKTKHPIDLGTLFFGAYRRQVLGLLLLHPDESFHLRELARITNTQPGTLRRELAQLAETGVLTRERVGNLVRYKADTSCPIYDELRGILKKTARAEIMKKENTILIGQKILVSRKTLRQLVHRYHIQRLVLFGSAARGELGPESDIDLLVEFEPDKAPSLGGMFEIQQAFSELFGGRKVDVATSAILNNPYRRRAIEKDMEELYAA